MQLTRPLRALAVLTVVGLLTAACARDSGQQEEEPQATDSGLFPGQTLELHEDYLPRNTVQTVGAQMPEDGERWSGQGWVFVANEVGRGVTVLDLRTLEPIEFVYSPDAPVPHHPYLSPDQRWVLADARFGSEVVVIDTHNDFETSYLEFPEAEGGEDVAGPLHATFTNDGRFYLVTLQRSDRLGVIDLEADGGPAIHEIIDLGDRPRDVYVTPDDEKAFVTMQGESDVAVVDIGSWDVRYIQRSESDYSEAGGGGGGMSADGELFGVSNTPDNEVAIIDVESEEVIHRISDVPAPVNAEFLGNTHILGTGNRSDGSATFIDADAGELLETVETGGGANIPYLGPDGNYWVSHNGAEHISVLDPDSFEILHEIGTGVNPHWIHFLPSGSRALVTHWGEDSISVIDTREYRQLATVQTGLNPNGIVVKTDITREQAQAALDEGMVEARQDVEQVSEMVLPEPADEQERTFLNNCTQCHDLGRIVRNNASTEAQWQSIVERMIGNGAQLTDEEADTIVDYLAEGRQNDLDFGTRYDVETGRIEDPGASDGGEDAPETEDALEEAP